MENLDLKIVYDIWLNILRFGHQLLVKSTVKVLTEYEALAYEAICEFIRQKAKIDAAQLEKLNNAEGFDEIEGGGT